MNRLKRTLICLLSLFMAFTSIMFVIPRKTYAVENIQRIEGVDRYDTAIAISKKGWTTSSNVVIATGESFPDALCAAPLARKLNAPILLAGNDDTVGALLKRIGELDASNAFIIGGTGVVSYKVEQQLKGMGINVERLYGTDRYGTALEVAKYMAERLGIGDQIAVATGDNYPDALSIAPVAAYLNMPIILAKKDGLLDEVMSFVRDKSIKKSYIIGGRGVVGSNVESALPGTVRLWGNDRYETNASILRSFKNTIDYSTTYIATGDNYPDAIAGSALAPITSSPIVLTSENINQSVAETMGLNYPSIRNMYILGGKGAVSERTKDVLSGLNVNTSGNSLSNINNYGIASMQDGWIYYSNFSDNQRLYKMKADRTQNQLILTDETDISHINVVGDLIYYSGSDGKVYSVKTDGSGKSLVIDDEVYFLYVSNGYIYYYGGGSLNRLDLKNGTVKKIITSDGRWHYYITGSSIYFIDGGRLYKTDLNGMGKALLINDSVVGFNISDYNIFYTTPDQKLYKTDTSGRGGTAVTSDRVSDININGSYIYYLNASDNNSPYRIAFDGSDREKLADYRVSGSINVTGNIVFCADMDLKTAVYTMSSDGASRTKIADSTAAYLVSSGDSVYYVDVQDNNNIYSMKNDGSMKKSLGVSSSGPIELYGGSIYYSSDDSSLHSIKTDGSSDISLNGISSDDFKVYDGWIYFSNLMDDNRLYKSKLDGTESVLVSSNSARNVTVYGGNIFYINDGDGNYGAGIYAVNNDGTNDRLIDSVSADNMIVSGGYVVYRNIAGSDDQIVRERPDGSDKMTLAGNKIDFASDGVYVYTIDGTSNIMTRYNPADGTNSIFDAEGDVFSIFTGSGKIYYQVNDSSLKLYQIPL